jgi:NADH-quinone oxidoreductase subunit L
VASLAIAGIPGLAGFFSKDEILWQVFSAPWGSKALYFVGLVTAAMTAFYMWRLMNLTFYGASRLDHHAAAHVHESPRTMTVPLTVLAAGSVLAGWIGVPKLWSVFPEVFRSFEHWLEPVIPSVAAEAAEGGHSSAGLEWMLMLVSVGVALGGIWLARHLYIHRPQLPEAIARSSGGLYKTLLNKWYVDEIYAFLFVNGLAKGGGSGLAAFDSRIVDGGVNGAGWMTRFGSTISIWWDTWIVDGSVRLLSFLVKLASYPMRVVQTGKVQGYALVFVLGVMALFAYMLMH